MACIAALTLLYLLKTHNYRKLYYNSTLRNFIKHQDPYETSVSKILSLQASLLPLGYSSGFVVVLCMLTSSVTSSPLAGQQERRLAKSDQQNSEITSYSPQEGGVIHHKITT